MNHPPLSRPRFTVVQKSYLNNPPVLVWIPSHVLICPHNPNSTHNLQCLISNIHIQQLVHNQPGLDPNGRTIRVLGRVGFGRISQNIVANFTSGTGFGNKIWVLYIVNGIGYTGIANIVVIGFQTGLTFVSSTDLPAGTLTWNLVCLRASLLSRPRSRVHRRWVYRVSEILQIVYSNIR